MTILVYKKVREREGGIFSFPFFLFFLPSFATGGRYQKKCLFFDDSLTLPKVKG